MKVAISPDNVSALKRLREEIKNKNEFAQKRISPIVNHLISITLDALSPAQIEELANRLLPPMALKKSRLKRLEKLAEDLGEEAILRLERRAKQNKDSQ